MGELHRPVPLLRGLDPRLSGIGDLRRFPAREGPAILTSTETWIDGHTDQVIIILSLVLGFWLIGKSIYLIP